MNCQISKCRTRHILCEILVAWNCMSIHGNVYLFCCRHDSIISGHNTDIICYKMHSKYCKLSRLRIVKEFFKTMKIWTSLHYTFSSIANQIVWQLLLYFCTATYHCELTFFQYLDKGKIRKHLVWKSMQYDRRTYMKPKSTD